MLGDQDFASRTASGCLEFRRIEIQAAPRASRAPPTLLFGERSEAKVTQYPRSSSPPRHSSIDAAGLPDCTFCCYTSRVNETEITRAAYCAPPSRKSGPPSPLNRGRFNGINLSKEQAFNSVANIVWGENKRKREAV